MRTPVHIYREPQDHIRPGSEIEIEVGENDTEFSCRLVIRQLRSTFDDMPAQEIEVVIDRRGAKVIAAALLEVAASLHKKGA